MLKNYENLANAVVELAFKDYVNVLKKLKKRPNNSTLLHEKKDLEKFFLGERITIFTSVDGKALMEYAKKEANS